MRPRRAPTEHRIPPARSRRSPARRERWASSGLVGACCLLLSGCFFVPKDDISAFMVDLAPRPDIDPDVEVLMHEIRVRTDVETFEFADKLDGDGSPLPGVASHLLRVMAGE